VNASQIAAYAANAGFSGADLVTAVAIALAESSGNPNAIGDVNLGGSIGLWQIYLPDHPEYSAPGLFDPQANADAAFAIYQAAGNSFSPWTTFKTGAYTENLSVSAPPVMSPVIDGDSGQLIPPDLLSGVEGPSIGALVIGGVLVAFGVWLWVSA